MAIVTSLVYTFISLTLVFYFLQLIYFKNKKQAQNQRQAGTQKLQPLPVAPLSSVRFVGRSIFGFLQHLGNIDKIVEFKMLSWVFINDLALAKELFKNPIFCGRKTSEVFVYFTRGSYGIVNTQGEQWKEQRKFTHLHLKEHGFGTKSMETFIHNEIDTLIESWCNKNEEPFSPNKSFLIPVLNSIWMILAGERAEEKDNKLAELVLRVHESFKETLSFPDVILLVTKTPLKLAHALMNFTPFFPRIKRGDRLMTELRLYFQDIINARKKTLNINDSAQDLIDAYLKESANTRDPSSEFFGTRAEMHLMATMTDMFIAGGDSTSSMLAWAMLHLIRNPDIQENIRNEIDRVVGLDRHPSVHMDRLQCPYTEAFLLELLRFSPNAPIGIPHAPTEDTNIGPYFISKNSIIHLNIYHILSDAKIWGDPENFRPERFLSDDGKSVVRHEAMCIFSLGLRRCVGEKVALDSMFLFVSRLCQRFILKPDPKLKEIPPLAAVTWANAAATFSMVATDRFRTIN